MKTFEGKFTHATVMIDTLDKATEDQIKAIVNHPAMTNPIVAMPDCHAGASNAVIGFTMKLGDKIIPNTVGKDINCGMLHHKFCDTGTMDYIVSNWKKFDDIVRSKVPMGMRVDEFPHYTMQNVQLLIQWDITSKLNKNNLANPMFKPAIDKALEFCNNEGSFKKYLDMVEMDHDRFTKAIGSLGSGNHFLEYSRDKNGFGHFVIHTGSRNFGSKVADYYTKLARSKLEATGLTYDFSLAESAYLEGDDAIEYLASMMIAESYAFANRDSIMQRILESVRELGCHPIHAGSQQCVHNYINFDDGIIRKGAISAKKDEFLIVPLTPKDGILIGYGKGNADWNYSAPHGAGRVLGRMEAIRTYTQEQADDVMKNVFASSRPIDESPLAYKNAEMIKEAVIPTMVITEQLFPIINMKAKSCDEQGDRRKKKKAKEIL